MIIDAQTRLDRQLTALRFDLDRYRDAALALDVLPDVLRRAVESAGRPPLVLPESAYPAEVWQQGMDRVDETVVHIREILEAAATSLADEAYERATELMGQAADLIEGERETLDQVTSPLDAAIEETAIALTERLQHDAPLARAFVDELSTDDHAPATALLGHAPDLVEAVSLFCLARERRPSHLVGWAPEPSPAELIVNVYKDWLIGHRNWIAVHGDGAQDYPTSLRLERLELAVYGVLHGWPDVMDDVVAIRMASAEALRVASEMGCSVTQVAESVSDAGGASLDDAHFDGGFLDADIADWDFRLIDAYRSAAEQEQNARQGLIVALAPVFNDPAVAAALRDAMAMDPTEDHTLLHAAEAYLSQHHRSIEPLGEPEWFTFARRALSPLPTVAAATEGPGIESAARATVHDIFTEALRRYRSSSVTELTDQVRAAAIVVANAPTAQLAVGRALATSTAFRVPASRPLVAAVAHALAVDADRALDATFAIEQFARVQESDRRLSALAALNWRYQALHRAADVRAHGELAMALDMGVMPALTGTIDLSHVETNRMSIPDPSVVEATAADLRRGRRLTRIGGTISESIGALAANAELARGTRAHLARSVRRVAEVLEVAPPGAVVEAAKRIRNHALPAGAAAETLRRAFAARGVTWLGRGPDDGHGEGFGDSPPAGPTPGPTPGPTSPHAGPAGGAQRPTSRGSQQDSNDRSQPGNANGTPPVNGGKGPRADRTVSTAAGRERARRRPSRAPTTIAVRPRGLRAPVAAAPPPANTRQTTGPTGPSETTRRPSIADLLEAGPARRGPALHQPPVGRGDGRRGDGGGRPAPASRQQGRPEPSAVARASLGRPAPQVSRSSPGSVSAPG